MTLRPYRPRRRALVVGAGIAGLLTARVLADTFAEVEVLEQDVLPTTPVQRPGVAQGHHVHGLTARGAEVMERLFPGLEGQLAAAGAPGGDFGQIVAFRFPDCWSPRVPTGIPLQTFSRPLLETHLRHRLTALDRIRVRDGVRVTGLTGSPTHVTGVRVRIRTAATTVTPDGPTVPPDGLSTTDDVLPADLVVVANGRTTHLPDWLAALGLDRPQRTIIDARVGYASRLYAISDSAAPPWAAAMELLQAPYVRRGFMATRIEGDRLLVTLQGAAGDHPPRDPDGFTAFAESLHTPLADLLARLDPVSSVRTYAHCANQRTHYHRLPHWPGGLLALGDAVCAFNPLYGQGMGIAAIAADLLHTMLARRTHHAHHAHLCDGDFTRAYQRRLARLTHRPWMMSTLQDRGWQPDPTSDRAARATGALLPVVQQAMSDNPEVFRRFLAAMHMTRSSAVLLHPRAVLPVVTTAIRPGRTKPDAPHLWWGHTPHTPTGPGTPTTQAPPTPPTAPPPRTP
ncbi:FAD-dependent oxidoreductase [Streptomyces noursei]|uniref:FAD-dependent oxidoreductase n=1 Tax=Streptomyces noursei TaxID=1971 RepID=UPI0037F63931